MGHVTFLKLKNPRDGSVMSYVRLPEGGNQITILADGHHMSVFHHLAPTEYIWVDCACWKFGTRCDGVTSLLDKEFENELDEVHNTLRLKFINKMRLPACFY